MGRRGGAKLADMKKLFASAALALAAAASATPAAAEVDSTSPQGFAIKHQAQVKASPDEVWEALGAPNRWWDSRHSFTGDADNFFMDMQAGGCFCERIRVTKDGKLENRGSVEHMRVVYAEPGKVLRMVGALGPLQSEGVAATLSVGLKPVDGGTRITFEYVVGGYMRYPIDEIAPAVDGVIGQQLARLAKLLGGGASSSGEKKAGPAEKPAGTDEKKALDDEE